MLEERDTNIKSYQDVHQSVSDALIQAQQAGEQTKIAATKESEAIISKAKAQADVIVNDAIEKARHLSFQTEDMKRQSKIFRSRFRMLVEAQLDLLKNDDWDYLLNYDFDAEQVTQENIQHLNPQDVNQMRIVKLQRVKQLRHYQMRKISQSILMKQLIQISLLLKIRMFQVANHHQINS